MLWECTGSHGKFTGFSSFTGNIDIYHVTLAYMVRVGLMFTGGFSNLPAQSLLIQLCIFVCFYFIKLLCFDFLASLKMALFQPDNALLFLLFSRDVLFEMYLNLWQSRLTQQLNINEQIRT